MQDVEMFLNQMTYSYNSLNPLLFDEKGVMHDDVREIFKNYLSYIYRTVLGYISGLKIADCYISGFCCGYINPDIEDINLHIIIKNKSCKGLVKDKRIFDRFLRSMYIDKCANYQFHIKDKKLNIVLGAIDNKMIGQYSILKNKWMMRPDKYALTDIDFNDIIKGYKDTQNSLDFLEEDIRNGNNLIDAYKNKDAYLNKLYTEQWSSLEKYIIYYLLKNRKGNMLIW